MMWRPKEVREYTYNPLYKDGLIGAFYHMDVKNPYKHDSTDPLYFLVMCSNLCELTISQ